MSFVRVLSWQERSQSGQTCQPTNTAQLSVHSPAAYAQEETVRQKKERKIRLSRFFEPKLFCVKRWLQLLRNGPLQDASVKQCRLPGVHGVPWNGRRGAAAIAPWGRIPEYSSRPNKWRCRSECPSIELHGHQPDPWSDPQHHGPVSGWSSGKWAALFRVLLHSEWTLFASKKQKWHTAVVFV